MYNSYMMNYAPYAIQNMFDGTQAPSAVKHDSVAYAFWCRSLYQRLCSVVEFNLPDSWNRARDYFEAVLFGRGFVCVFDSKEFGVAFQNGNISGYDFYYQPTQCTVSNIKLSKTFTIGKDCSLIKLTNDFHGVTDIIAYYAEKLATLDGATNMSIINSKFAYCIAAKNKASARAVSQIFDRINRGESTIIFDAKLTEGLGGEDPITFIDRQSLANSYLTDKLLNDAQTIINSFDSEIGINTMPPEKRERMLTDEVNSKKADSSARVTLWEECLRNSIKDVNEMFGTDISFKFRFREEENENDEGVNNKWELQSLQWRE